MNRLTYHFQVVFASRTPSRITARPPAPSWRRRLNCRLELIPPDLQTARWMRSLGLLQNSLSFRKSNRGRERAASAVSLLRNGGRFSTPESLICGLVAPFGMRIVSRRGARLSSATDSVMTRASRSESPANSFALAHPLITRQHSSTFLILFAPLNHNL